MIKLKWRHPTMNRWFTNSYKKMEDAIKRFEHLKRNNILVEWIKQDKTDEQINKAHS